MSSFFQPLDSPRKPMNLKTFGNIWGAGQVLVCVSTHRFFLKRSSRLLQAWLCIISNRPKPTKCKVDWMNGTQQKLRPAPHRQILLFINEMVSTEQQRTFCALPAFTLCCITFFLTCHHDQSVFLIKRSLFWVNCVWSCLCTFSGQENSWRPQFDIWLTLASHTRLWAFIITTTCSRETWMT